MPGRDRTEIVPGEEANLKPGDPEASRKTPQNLGDWYYAPAAKQVSQPPTPTRSLNPTLSPNPTLSLNLTLTPTLTLTLARRSPTLTLTLTSSARSRR